MTSALIGYTGFVGSNVRDSQYFDDTYNSKNIDDIRGQAYDLVVTAGNRADSYRINRHQSDDLAEINALADRLEAASIAKLVLVSTVCVYPAGGAPNEETALSERGLTPYGQNRLHQERRLADSFDTLIVRLPQLYGAHLKKGIVYDLANDYRVEHIRPEGRFQYYDARQLWGAIEVALAADLASLNLATPALASERVARECFGIDLSHNVFDEPEDPYSQMYTRNMTTTHSALFGATGSYLKTESDVLRDVRALVDELRTDSAASTH